MNWFDRIDKDAITMCMIKATDIDTLDSFKRDTKAHLKRLKKSGDPCVLTVNGKGAVVIQDAAAYERQMRALEYAEIRQALDEADVQSKRGEGMTVDEAFSRLRDRVKKPRSRRRSA